MKKLILILVTFTNCLLFSQSISFISFGDWGRQGKYGQKETADAMGKYAGEHKTDFILLLGDNFYPTGVKSVDDPHWKVSFDDVYTAPSLEIPWYAALGNHDYGGNTHAQIDYTNISSRWKMPDEYYSFEQSIDDKTKALFVIIDSSPFVKSYRVMDKENGELDSAAVKQILRQDTDVQLRWLDSVLSSSNAKWKIVAAHHPVYSGGDHGDTPELVEEVKPLLVKYNANMFLCGHDHDMQHIVNPESNVNYFVAGTGSKLRLTTMTPNSLFAASENGFLAVTIDKDKIKASFIGLAGSELYTYEIK